VFKLVAVGGKKRGTEYVLEDGENNFGRAGDCEHMLEVEGISKKHMRITVSGDNCFLEDLGSSNGTFVNGKLVKKKTVKDKDRIALPNIIFQVVFVKEKKKIIKKKILKSGEEDDSFDFVESEPDNLLGKIKFAYKHKVMKVLYGFNEQYEWNVMLGILIFLFICGNIYFTVGPVLTSTEEMVYTEIKSRGKQYADEVARTNAIHLSRGDLQRIDTLFMEKLQSEGVESYELFDMDGRIVRPSSKIDTYIRDVFSVKSKDIFKNSGRYNKTFIDKNVGNGVVGIAKTLMVNNMKTGQNEPVGIIAIRFKPDSMRKFNVMNSTAYWKALVYTGILAVFFYGFIYYLTLRPLEELRFQAEEVMRGKRKELSSDSLFVELNSLRNSFNSVLLKNRELRNEDVGDFAEIEDDITYISVLKEIMQGTNGAAMILSSEKNVEYVNEAAGDLTGMRENLVQGQNILDCASNEGFAGTLIKLCDDSANNAGTSQEEFYELEGDPYVINVMSMIGKDNFAKAFYITFFREK
jgi:hypothetical protein